MAIAKIALTFVVLIDVMGQGLAFPIFSVLLLSDQSTMLAADTTGSTRQLYYGILIGLFFLSWFLGSIYISKISDSIGRKRGILICLVGTLAGYLLAAVAIAISSFWLLVLSRVITGFTAGNQPIAQAALVDLAGDDAERDRNLGLVMLGVGIGLVGGPIVGGVFSLGIFGSWALLMPFLVGALLVATLLLVIVWFFKETSTTRVPLQVHPAAVFTLMWEVTRRPVVLRISLMFFPYMIGFIAFYVFFDTALETWFDYGTTGQSTGMFVMGAAMAVTSTVLFPKIMQLGVPRTVITAAVIVQVAGILTFVGIEIPVVAFVCAAVIGATHAVIYTEALGLFSASVEPENQGWVMGVAVALFTLASGVASLIGGIIGAANFDGMFYFAAAIAFLSLSAVAFTWRTGRTHQLATTRDRALA